MMVMAMRLALFFWTMFNHSVYDAEEREGEGEDNNVEVRR